MRWKYWGAVSNPGGEGCAPIESVWHSIKCDQQQCLDECHQYTPLDNVLYEVFHHCVGAISVGLVIHSTLQRTLEGGDSRKWMLRRGAVNKVAPALLSCETWNGRLQRRAKVSTHRSIGPVRTAVKNRHMATVAIISVRAPNPFARPKKICSNVIRALDRE
jgi:hypothetical protein